MPDETPSASVNRELTSTIVAAYVGRSQIASDQLAALISTVQEAITSLGKPAQESEGEGTPRCRFGDRFIAITSSAWIAAGRDRCFAAISRPVTACLSTPTVLTGTCRVSIQ